MIAGRWTVRHLVLSGRDLFQEWFAGLRDLGVRAQIAKRVDRIKGGNFGDHRSVGGGVWELRIHRGPGYRVYYGVEGRNVVLLVSGGAKDAQSRDVIRARALWAAHCAAR